MSDLSPAEVSRIENALLGIGSALETIATTLSQIKVALDKIDSTLRSK